VRRPSAIGAAAPGPRTKCPRRLPGCHGGPGEIRRRCGRRRLRLLLPHSSQLGSQLGHFPYDAGEVLVQVGESRVVGLLRVLYVLLYAGELGGDVAQR
jgi:hypothetical protein